MLETIVHVPIDELQAIIQSNNTLAIGMKVYSNIIEVHLNNLDIIKVMKTDFTPTPKCQPDFIRCSIIDHGQTLKFGDYEVAVDAL